MADVRVGGAYIDWRARNAQFLTGLNRNKRAMREQGRVIERLRLRVRQFNAAARRIPVILAAAAAGTAVLVRRQAAFGAQLVQVSQRLGFSVERVQLLQRAFEGEGIAISTTNIGLQRFTRRLADAAQGNALLLRTFNQLGVELRDSGGGLRDSHDVLLDVAEGLRRTDDQAERVRRAFQLFDSEGVAFVNVLQRGRDALLAEEESFRQLGVVTGDQARILKNLDQSFTDLATSLRVAAAVAASEAAPEFQRLNEILRSIGPDVIRSIASAAATVAENLTAVRDTALFVGLLLAGRFVAQTIAAAGALRGLAASTIAVRIGLAALSGPGGWIFLVGSALAFLLLRLETAREETSALARSVENLLTTQPEDTINVLESSIRRYERQIQLFRQRLERPITLRVSLEVRGLIGQHEEELARLRERLVEALAAAVPTPESTPLPSTPTRRRRDVGSDIRAGIERQTRAARQRIDLLRAEGAERIKLEARFEVANRLVDEQIKLSAALVTAQGAERESLLAEQAALDRSVRSIDSLIAAKREQLEIDQRAVSLAAFQRALAAREAVRPSASPVVGRIAGLSDLLEAEDETARFLAGVSADLEQRAARVQARLNILAGADEASEQVRLQFRERELALQQQLLTLRREASTATGEARIEAQEAAAGVQHQIDLLRESAGEVEEIAARWRQVQEAERQANTLAMRHVDIARVAVDALADGLANAAAHARSLGDALRSIALTITGSLLRTFLPGLIGGAGGSRTTLDFPFVSRQAGGPLRAGQSALVGEAGPEIFRSSSAGNIIPLGTGGVNLSIGPINIESSDGPGVRAALGDLIPVLRDEVIQGVRQTLRVDARRPSPA